MEMWKAIDGFGGVYQVSSLGRIKSLPKFIRNNKSFIIREGVLKSPRNMRGYRHIGLWHESKRQGFFVHRLVAMAFIPNPEMKPFINHKNGIKSDNRIDNLEWVTQSENEKHAHATGLKNFKGERGLSTKLSELNVLEIRRRLLDGEKACSLSQEFAVSQATISNIKSRKHWNYENVLP